MDIAEWRKQIDEIDRRIIRLLNERARAAQAIGKLKRNTAMPVDEPDREQVILENVRRENHGPLPDVEVTRIYDAHHRRHAPVAARGDPVQNQGGRRRHRI